MVPGYILAVPLLSLFFGGGKNLGGDTQIDTMVKLVVPNLARGPRLALDAFLAGLVVGQGLGTRWRASLADTGHLIDGFVVFVGLNVIGTS